MTKKSSQGRGRSIAGGCLALLVVLIAGILTQVTGIDFIGIVDDAVGDTTVVTVTDIPEVEIRIPESVPGSLTPLLIQNGFGATKGFWTVYFNAPLPTNDRSLYVDGPDYPLAAAINDVRGSLDIAAFEFNNDVLTQAVLDAHDRGVQVRIVTDDEHGIEEEDESIPLFIEAGIPVVDDSRSALMHNKFMIMDRTTVWMGSMNYTVNGAYRNNNHILMLRSQRAVRAYQAEFEEMFVRREFGVRSSQGTAQFTQDGTPIEIYFAAEDDVVGAINEEIANAQDEIRFMAFSFTQDDIGAAMLDASLRGVELQGIFELRGSETRFSELGRMFCSGLDVRQDGNRFVLHHKVILIDDHTVITGSFNFSANATESNDENLIIVKDPDLVTMFMLEYERRWAEATPPPAADIDCG